MIDQSWSCVDGGCWARWGVSLGASVSQPPAGLWCLHGSSTNTGKTRCCGSLRTRRFRSSTIPMKWSWRCTLRV